MLTLKRPCGIFHTMSLNNTSFSLRRIPLYSSGDFYGWVWSCVRRWFNKANVCTEFPPAMGKGNEGNKIMMFTYSVFPGFAFLAQLVFRRKSGANFVDLSFFSVRHLYFLFFLFVKKLFLLWTVHLKHDLAFDCYFLFMNWLICIYPQKSLRKIKNYASNEWNYIIKKIFECIKIIIVSHRPWLQRLFHTHI